MASADPAESPAAPQDEIVETHHTATIGGQTFGYTVRTGRMVLKEEAEKPGEPAGLAGGEKPRATVFFVAYSRDDVVPRSRPITFSFNGGPGSASVWLHLGLLGPQRVQMDPEGRPLPPPYRMVPNEHSLLDLTDLVFIDPVSTGYSRVVAGEPTKSFHGFTRDIESVGDFIRLYTSRYGRWGSPKYLIGESYGTTRAGGLAGYLQNRHGMYLNGLMLISSILNFQTATPLPGNDLPYLLFLPTYTATAWYHGRLPEDLQQGDLRAALAEAEAFASGPYALALMRGAALPPDEHRAIAAQLARLTGLDQGYIERCDLRIHDERFVKELLREQRRTVGRLDSRFSGIDRDAVGERVEHDPSLSAILGPYTAALNAYVRGDLGYASDLPYEVLSGRVHPWSYAEHENRFVDVSETLRAAICVNPALKVLIASGYYDLATPYFATDYTVNHLGLDRELQPNIAVRYYEAGHMMYIHQPSLAQLRADLAAFLAG